LQVIQMIRPCPDCGSDRSFEQHHAEVGGCPDTPYGYCPEWSCTVCGAALFIGFIPYLYESAEAPGLQSRVA
jgi:hypothetical protein